MSQSIPPILWADTIGAGASWSLILRRGNILRLEDTEGGANVAALFYNFDCPVERYNMPDTLKAQHTAHLTEGFVLYSDMGRVLAPSPGTRAAGTTLWAVITTPRPWPRSMARQLSGAAQCLAPEHPR